jgi:hypothetical protein
MQLEKVVLKVTIQYYSLLIILTHTLWPQILYHLFLYLCTYASLLGLLFCPEGEGSIFLQNYDNLLPDYMASQPRTPNSLP